MHSPEQQPEIDVLLHVQHGLEAQLKRVQDRLIVLLDTNLDDVVERPHLYLVRGDGPDGAA